MCYLKEEFVVYIIYTLTHTYTIYVSVLLLWLQGWVTTAMAPNRIYEIKKITFIYWTQNNMHIFFVSNIPIPPVVMPYSTLPPEAAAVLAPLYTISIQCQD